MTVKRIQEITKMVESTGARFYGISEGTDYDQTVLFVYALRLLALPLAEFSVEAIKAHIKLLGLPE